MSVRIRHGRAALVGIALAALFAALLEPAFSIGAGGSASRDAMVTLARTALPKL